jgi:prevent-host-death family protein
MPTYTLRSLRTQLGHAVRQAETGEVVTVTNRGREVARIVPPTVPAALRSLPSLDAQRAAMVRDGATITASSVVALRDEERA